MKSRKEIIDFINEVAIIEDLKPTITSSRSTNEDIEVKYNDEFININMDDNITLGTKVIKLKDDFKTCELNCGNIINRQVIYHSVYTYPVYHWRTSCKSCKRTMHPDKTHMIDNNCKIPSIFNTWFKNN